MNKKIVIGVLVVLALLIVGLLLGKKAGVLGGASGPNHYTKENFLQGLFAGGRDQFSISNAGVVKIGTNGGNINELKSTTCDLITTQLPLEATSTDAFYCAITGVASGDQVYVTLPSDAGSSEGFGVSYAKASSTAGFIEVGIRSNFQNATTSFTLATTGVQVLYIDN